MFFIPTLLSLALDSEAQEYVETDHNEKLTDHSSHNLMYYLRERGIIIYFVSTANAHGSTGYSNGRRRGRRI